MQRQIRNTSKIQKYITRYFSFALNLIRKFCLDTAGWMWMLKMYPLNCFLLRFFRNSDKISKEPISVHINQALKAQRMKSWHHEISTPDIQSLQTTEKVANKHIFNYCECHALFFAGKVYTGCSKIQTLKPNTWQSS